MKSLFICFAALFMMIAIPWVFNAVDDTLTQDYTQTFAGVTTGGGVYAANVTLASATWNDNMADVTVLASNVSSDAPSASAYNDISHQLSISGLDESATRTLSATFLIDSTTLPEFFSTFLVLFRWFYMFICLGMAGGAIYAFTQS
jgi:hypothetical protein